MIIDLGSTNNIISEEVVSELKLKRIPHTNPYKVTYLNKTQHILVGEQAWVEFTIGKYKDRVLCEFFPLMHVTFYLEVRGNLIVKLYMMVLRTPIPSRKME